MSWSYATLWEHLQKYTKLVSLINCKNHYVYNYAASLAGVFYYQLGNLRPKYRSSLCSIHLVSIAKSSVIQKYGPDKILEPFISDIKKLEKVEL